MSGFDDGGVKALLEVNERLVAEVIHHSELLRLTLGADGSVVPTGLRVEGYRRGFNPHRPEAPSHYPITAYEEYTGQVLRVRNLSGNDDGKASLPFLGELFEQLCATLKRCPVLEMRMDGAFFQAAVIDALDEEAVEYAMNVPFWRWLGTQGADCQTPALGTCGRHRGVLRSVAVGVGMVTRDACRGVSRVGASPDGEELST